ncbi:MAG: PilT/PilU family type 4a pilus ATPase [Gemmatimonadales bacterium]|nr:PilT/PilU family type 4a pilus ATPase [Gemmatimonadales bacterium]
MAGAREGSRDAMEKIIRAAIERGASDLHIKAGDVFRARIGGRLVALTKQRLTPLQTRVIAQRLLPTDADRERLDTLRDVDCSWGLPGVGRFRVNISRQRSSIMIVMRIVPFTVPTLGGLGLPDVLARLAESARGLVLLAGVPGSGRSTTLAAMVQHLNASQPRHVICLEQPIEFLHRDLKGSITQREVGVDTDDFASGVRAALRQDPDVIVLGDVTDGAAFESALKAAETGRLVLAATPTRDVAATLERLTSLLPREERDVGRIRLADALLGVVAQRLLPRADGRGRVAVCEVLLATPAVREMLREGGRLEIGAIIEEGAASGMQTFGQHAAQLAEAGVLPPDGLLPTTPSGPRRARSAPAA